MSRGAQTQLAKSRDLPNPNIYVQALLGEYSAWALDEERAPRLKGNWRSEFGGLDKTPLDLEIGTGNGHHFAWRAQSNPERFLIGIELKYKPLIQSIRRARSNGSENVRMLRYNARLLTELFQDEELNDIVIHHPDPWLKKSQRKHRLIQTDFLSEMHRVQRPRGVVEFKTDSEDYYNWALPLFRQSPYQLIGETRDLHQSDFAADNFVTQFEQLFLSKGQPIFYAKLLKG